MCPECGAEAVVSTIRATLDARRSAGLLLLTWGLPAWLAAQLMFSAISLKDAGGERLVPLLHTWPLALPAVVAWVLGIFLLANEPGPTRRAVRLFAVMGLVLQCMLAGRNLAFDQTRWSSLWTWLGLAWSAVLIVLIALCARLLAELLRRTGASSAAAWCRRLQWLAAPMALALAAVESAVFVHPLVLLPAPNVSGSRFPEWYSAVLSISRLTWSELSIGAPIALWCFALILRFATPLRPPAPAAQPSADGWETRPRSGGHPPPSPR